MIEAGNCLSEKEIERFYARVEAARKRNGRQPPNELRGMLERRYQETHRET